MPVDRTLLPPLPGKPEWYVDGAARAALEDHAALAEASEERAESPVATELTEATGPTPLVTNYTTGSAVPAGHPPAGRDRTPGREKKRVLAGLFRH